MSPRTKDSPTPYEPSRALQEAEKAWRLAEQELEEKRNAYRQAIADELKASGLSHGKMAEHTPWTEETVRGIAREYGVAPKRKPTVRSINS